MPAWIASPLLKYALAAGAGAALAAASAGAIYWYGQIQREAGRAECQEAQRVAGLEEFKAEAERLTGLSQAFADSAEKLATAKPKVIERYTHEIIKTPLPAGCVRDAGRVLATNDGIDAANAAGQLGSAVPSDSAR